MILFSHNKETSLKYIINMWEIRTNGGSLKDNIHIDKQLLTKTFIMFSKSIDCRS